MRAPEFVLPGELGVSLDVWSFGCLVFEFITGQPLFGVLASEWKGDDYLVMLITRLNPLPEDYPAWETASCYFNSDGTSYNCVLGGVRKGKEVLLLPQVTREEIFDLGEDEATRVKEPIRWILQYDAAKRPTAAEVAQHP